ncbi:NEDD4-like E3 ubiquitin-protein ligase WWP1 isoform X8 [Epinephelus fuscoguttatus]|uniref:NEDD4-like E3 ubiquitin-protein ligase WWP1 isoform X8 n=2 Tax=Epinephelus fuscoguttatus TaxID=293821 RepID=UPI0020D05F8D|nr:NEDD4-like E3 ubiquitin-protein ligase WWP1 isoform X8 [Epinephelus fuscoguttatus]
MAADPKPDWLSSLPSSWSYGVTRDGRIFFINEEAKSTTWLHPVTGEAVITGHRKTPDLPTGWEEGYTFEGARCFIKDPAHLSCSYSLCKPSPQSSWAEREIHECLACERRFSRSDLASNWEFKKPLGNLSVSTRREPGDQHGEAAGSHTCQAKQPWTWK